MAGGDAVSAMEAQSLSAKGYVPVEPAPKTRPLQHVGRCAAALCCLAILATLGLLVLTVAGVHFFWPDGGAEVTETENLDEIVDTTSTDTTSTNTTSTDTTSTDDAQEFSDMLDLVNHERQKHGLSDLCYNKKLIDAAKAHADDIAAHHKLSHRGSDGSLPADRVRRVRYRWRRVSENVASGQDSVKTVMQSWMSSTGHRANILRHGISHFGFGRTGNYWTQLFASPLGPESCMLEGGGEDGHGGHCRDVVPRGTRRWHDSDGAGYHCDWYAQGSGRCEDHGKRFKNFGYTASQACCACGGGLGGCLDKTIPGGGEWYDLNDKHCDWYAAEEGHCASNGASDRNHGIVANEACCACGGGTKLADTPAAPAPVPRPPCSTPSTGSCCNSRCEKHSDCAGRGLFCSPFRRRCMDRRTWSTRGPNCNACIQ